MAHEVKNRLTLKNGELGYLFFGQQQTLWQGDYHDEEHEDILAASGKNKSEITVAGDMSVDKNNRIVVDGFGSYSPDIPERSPAPVAEFIKGLVGVEAEKVIYCGQPN